MGFYSSFSGGFKSDYKEPKLEPKTDTVKEPKSDISKTEKASLNVKQDITKDSDYTMWQQSLALAVGKEYGGVEINIIPGVEHLDIR